MTESMGRDQEAADAAGGGEGAAYEFMPQEEQLLELIMNSMRVAGLALALEALSTFLLGALSDSHHKCKHYMLARYGCGRSTEDAARNIKASWATLFLKDEQRSLCWFDLKLSQACAFA